MVRKTVGTKKPVPVPRSPKVGGGGPGLWARIPRKLKIAAAAVAALPAIVLLYTIVRAIQYAAADGVAASRIPAAADVVVVAPGFEETFARWRATGAWEAIQHRILKDPHVREIVNASLVENGLPTLDQLDDDRFLSSDEGRMFDPDRLLAYFGRDVAFGARDDGRFVVVTKMSFGQFWAAPFASWAPGVESDAAGIKIDRGDGRFLWVAFDGDLALIADDPEWLGAAMAGGYSPPESDKPVPVRAEVQFRSPDTVKAFDEFIHSFPIGIFGHFGDVKGATGARMTIGMEGASLRGTVELIGGRLISGEGEPLEMLSRVPEGNQQLGTFYVQPTLARGRVLWDWLKQSVLSPDEASYVIQWASGDLRFTIKLATEFGFDTDVLPLLDGPSLIAFGHAPTTLPSAYGQPMLVGAVLFRSSRAEEAERKIEGILDKIVADAEWQKKGALIRRIQERESVLRVMGTNAAYDYFHFVSPCFTRIGDVIVIATHDGYLRDIVAAAAGARPRFTESGWWPTFRQGLDQAGLGDVLEPGAVSSGVVHLDLFRRSTLVFIAPMVEFPLRGTRAQTELNNRIRETWRREGRAFTDEQVRTEVEAETARRVARAADEVRRQVEVLKWCGTLGVRAEPTDEGVLMRWALQLYANN